MLKKLLLAIVIAALLTGGYGLVSLIFAGAQAGIGLFFALLGFFPLATILFILFLVWPKLHKK